MSKFVLIVFSGVTSKVEDEPSGFVTISLITLPSLSKRTSLTTLSVSTICLEVVPSALTTSVTTGSSNIISFGLPNSSTFVLSTFPYVSSNNLLNSFLSISLITLALSLVNSPSTNLPRSVPTKPLVLPLASFSSIS